MYDLRSQTLCSELTTFSGNQKSQAWEDWWAIKHERNSQLLKASELGDLYKVKELLDSERHGELVADINTKELDDFTPLHNSTSEGHSDIVKFLLDKGAGVNNVTTSMRTPLHIACCRGNREIIEYLIIKGANINAQEKEGNTPAHILAECGWTESLSFLLRLNPDLSIKNNYGLTAPEVSANIEIRNLFFPSPSMEQPTGYTRTVVDKLVLHNNRADMIKSLMFKGQLLAQTKCEPPKEERKVCSNGQQSKKRRIKIIEATRKITEINVEKLKSRIERKTSASSDEEHVGPEYFQPLQMLGKGSFGEVYLVKYKPTGKLYAMKVLSKDRFMSQNLLRYAMAERNVLCYNKHPFIVGLDFAFQTSEKLFLILEYCPGYSCVYKRYNTQQRGYRKSTSTGEETS
eukprot:TRINITY_DN3100_c1_g1_i1.p1 TRINITY_DN3100_c1_g1~~TRINITY_DN3100_c1_g1_i1.p1  ORF type:complete len:403 (+),score=39.20 TRINITY_DN3100_c1_g1_i1:1459-2667(+)